MNLNKISLYALRELNVIQLYEFKYIDQDTFFNLVTGCGEQTEYEVGRDRLIFYLKLVADSEKDEKQGKFDYFIHQYS
ncbi:hypothetical protein [Enterococcus hulanensis]|uniref:hypothetical protein n=1 Tax=Enterococcus hulanensis TaxID=2559929 RepID=UPI0010F75376|nr:hypothetical protein [Enterococcus hulanensis]